MTTYNRSAPDGLLLVIAYYLMLALGFLFGSLIFWGVALPAAINAGSYVVAGGIAIGIVGSFALIMGGMAAYSVYGLWRLKASGRALAVMLSALMLLILLPSMPILVIMQARIGLPIFLIGAGFLVLVNAGSLFYLMHPRVKALFAPQKRKMEDLI